MLEKGFLEFGFNGGMVHSIAVVDDCVHRLIGFLEIIEPKMDGLFKSQQFSLAVPLGGINPLGYQFS